MTLSKRILDFTLFFIQGKTDEGVFAGLSGAGQPMASGGGADGTQVIRMVEGFGANSLVHRHTANKVRRVIKAPSLFIPVYLLFRFRPFPETKNVKCALPIIMKCATGF